MQTERLETMRARRRRREYRPDHSAIELRAYSLFLARGSEHGRDFDDWLTAEAQLIAEQHGASPRA